MLRMLRSKAKFHPVQVETTKKHVETTVLLRAGRDFVLELIFTK